jgi:hypothetical protein
LPDDPVVLRHETDAVDGSAGVAGVEGGHAAHGAGVGLARIIVLARGTDDELIAIEAYARSYPKTCDLA